MNTLQNSGGSSNDEEDMLLAIHLCGVDLIAYAVKTATELDLFESMAKARPLGTHLSTLDLASKAAPNNPEASVMIDRLLRLLVAHSVCTCKLVKDEQGRESRTRTRKRRSRIRPLLRRRRALRSPAPISSPLDLLSSLSSLSHVSRCSSRRRNIALPLLSRSRLVTC
ncbi:Winged helix-turn-helix DNA-binding domain protein [Raphanus sativus]|nr:Winged helix-turn-helix DNA-binding domain protein [Raphanus sativus]